MSCCGEAPPRRAAAAPPPAAGAEAPDGLGQADGDAAQYISTLLPTCALGVDIGGTAGKCAFLLPAGVEEGEGEAPDAPASPKLSASLAGDLRAFLARDTFGETGKRLRDLDLASPLMGGRICFIKWDTRRVQPFCEKVRDERARAARAGAGTPDASHGVSPPAGVLQRPQRYDMYATGGGAFKFEDVVAGAFDIQYHKLGEFDSLVLGLRYLLSAHPETVYTFQDRVKKPAGFDASQYPIAVCNIGSGTSVLKIEADGSFQRLGGTSIGGSTFYGLCKLVVGADSTFDDCMRLAREGDAAEVDITVGDIYGEAGAAVLNLPLLAPASSFGKLASMDAAEVAALPRPALAASTLAMTTQGIQQIAMGLAKKGQCSTVFFTGGFLRGNDLSQRKLCEFARMVGEEAYFMEHSEYAGALGCLWKSHAKRSQATRKAAPRPFEGGALA
eukprot:TRINITY_DN7499_c0_g1_i1.p1 TRINITY_DN7499_c0_g1~~TRINITY_DN7499_c0_g1_i1.p1  ORF type:complete len:445 (+),score=140.79 TRINITY_DN7499_c0_g1_i1:123-1457(+)